MPKDQSDLVFATAGYEASISNLKAVTLSSDMVFSDSYARETPGITGSVADGYVLTFTSPVTPKT